MSAAATSLKPFPHRYIFIPAILPFLITVRDHDVTFEEPPVDEAQRVPDTAEPASCHTFAPRQLSLPGDSRALIRHHHVSSTGNSRPSAI